MASVSFLVKIHVREEACPYSFFIRHGLGVILMGLGVETQLPMLVSFVIVGSVVRYVSVCWV